MYNPLRFLVWGLCENFLSGQLTNGQVSNHQIHNGRKNENEVEHIPWHGKIVVSQSYDFDYGFYNSKTDKG